MSEWEYLFITECYKLQKLDFGVVIKTHSDNLLFDFDTIPENIIVVDHFELTIEKWLSKSQQLL